VKGPSDFVKKKLQPTSDLFCHIPKTDFKNIEPFTSYSTPTDGHTRHSHKGVSPLNKECRLYRDLYLSTMKSRICLETGSLAPLRVHRRVSLSTRPSLHGSCGTLECTLLCRVDICRNCISALQGCLLNHSEKQTV
jgi:hypothetical protein